LIPSVDDTHDLGSATDEWRNIYIDGTAQVDTLQVDESATITANLTVNGNTTLGNAATDTVTVTADVASNLIPSADNTYDIGATGSEWKDLYITGTANIDSLVADTAAISAGTATLSAATVITTTGGAVTLQRNDSAITTGETLGAVDFQAPNVAGGGNATLVTASIKAVSDTTFDATNNKTSLLLQTANADVVATRVEVTGEGHVLPGVDDAYDLGSTTKEWRNLWVDGTANIDSLVADTVAISGGTITGITDLAVADGGTGASTLTGYVKGNGTSAFTASATIPAADIAGLSTSFVSKTSATGAAVVPAGTQAQRDGSPSSGYFRFNTDISRFEGYNGSAWGAVGGGATGGGSDDIFIQNGQTVTTNYTIPADKNAMSTGPITINAGITVTVSTGARYVVI
jgi:hypothetical protein